MGSGTVQDAGGSAAVLRVDEAGRGVAVATDGNGRWCALDPAQGARLLVAEAARNVACTGARPVAATNNLNFASPEVPEVMGSFAATIDGMAEACTALGTPVTGGNVSFYNQTGDRPINPTPVVGVLGVIDDVAGAVGIGLREPGDALWLVGAPTRPGLGGSAYQRAVEGRLAGAPPALDLDAEVCLQRFLVAAAPLLRSAHDVAAGGLLTTLVESCLAGGLGAAVDPEPGLDPHEWLFSESPTRVVVSVAAERVEELRAALHDAGVPAQPLGTVTGARRLRVAGVVDVDLDEVRRRQEAALPAALGEDTAPSGAGA